MIELSLLGLHALRGPDGRELTSLPAQPKRFALLAYLALGDGGYHRRDTLVSIFWPEMGQFAARRALRNTLYHLREALGDNVIVTRGDDAVSFNPSMLTSDVAHLRQAVAAGRHEEAIGCYRGELLAGVHFVSEGEAFEEWLTRERQQLLDLVLTSVDALVQREEQAGNLAQAASWAQRACAFAPSDERWLRRAMTLLDRCNDTGTALRLYEAFAARIAAEFRAKPSHETTLLAQSVRRGRHEHPASIDVTPSPGVPLIASVPLAAGVPAVEEQAVAASTVPVLRRGRGRPLVLVAVLCATVVTIAVGLAVRGRTASAPSARTRVLVSVFDNRTGDTVLQSLGRMTQDWIAQGLWRTQLVEVVDQRAVIVQSRTAAGVALDPLALARRNGAAILVSGSYYRAGDTLFFQAALTDVRTGSTLHVVGPIVTSMQAPVAALDELRSRVMSALASSVNVHTAQGIGRGEVPPFDAYQPYVQGWDAFWHGDRRRAQALFLQAAHRDTAFALAAVAAATTAANGGDCPLVDSLAGTFENSAHPLERVDRLTVEIAVALCHGQNDEMLRLALERVELEPATSGLQTSAAAAALWANRPQRALDILKRINPDTDLGWSTDSTHFDYWSELTEAYHLLGRHDEELAAANRVPMSAPLSRAWMRGRALAALSRPSAALAVIDSAANLPVETPNVGLAPFTDGRPQYTATPAWVADWIGRELIVHGDSVAAHQAAQRAVNWYRGRSPEERATVEERIVATRSYELLGDYADAMRIDRELLKGDSTNVDFRGELASLAALVGDTALADSTDRWLAVQPVARVTWSASIYRARVAALLSRRDDAVLRTREARDQGAWPLWIHLDPAFGSVRGRPDFAALMAVRD